MTKTKTYPWDVVDHLKTDEDCALYLDAALEEGDSAFVAGALGDIARAKGMTDIALEAGLTPEQVAGKSSAFGSLELATLLKVIHALGLQLHATPLQNAG